jgi:hypothetical protein
VKEEEKADSSKAQKLDCPLLLMLKITDHNNFLGNIYQMVVHHIPTKIDCLWNSKKFKNHQCHLKVILIVKKKSYSRYSMYLRKYILFLFN